MSEITLENMEFHAYHGCLEHENTLGNTFLVTLSMQFDTTAAEKTDQLSDTLNYKLVYDVVKAEMEIRLTSARRLQIMFQKNKLDLLAKNIETHSPAFLLKHGYTITTINGKRIHSVAQLKTG